VLSVVKDKDLTTEHTENTEKIEPQKALLTLTEKCQPV